MMSDCVLCTFFFFLFRWFRLLSFSLCADSVLSFNFVSGSTLSTLLPKAACLHSVLKGFQIELQKPSMRPLQDKSLCFRGSENILHETLELRAWHPPPRQPG